MITVPIGRLPSTLNAWSTPSPSSESSPAPIRPLSSRHVNAAITVGRPAAGIAATDRHVRITAATADLLSAPRIVSPAERITPSSPRTGTIGSVPDSTVSIWATNSSVGAAGSPDTVASRLPLSEPLTIPASSRRLSMAASASHMAIASATARSRPLGDGIETSAQNNCSIGPSPGSTVRDCRDESAPSPCHDALHQTYLYLPNRA